MSGTATSDLTVAQATAILQSVFSSLKVVLSSPLRTKPGELITASLIPASPLLDVSELANGILNLAVTSKDVLFQNAKAIAVPDPASPGDFGGDALAGTTNILGGEPFPPPLGSVTGSTLPTATNIPGLLGQIFGSVAIPRLKVRVQIKWIVRRNGQVLEETTDFLAPEGIGSPTLSLLLPPLIHEMRFDTLTLPPIDLACISAQVSLSLGSTTLPTLEVPPVPVLLLPLLIPTVVAMFSEPNFGVLNPTLTLVVVPLHSPLGSLKPLIDILNRVQNIIDRLSGLAQFAGWILGINELIGALTDQPRVRFMNRDAIGSFDDVDVKPGPLFGVLGDDTFDDEAKSLLMIGVPGTKAWFYNADGQDTSGDEGWYALQILNDSLYVMVRDLGQTDASSYPPDPYPYYSIPSTDWHKDSYGMSPTWWGSMSSFQFDPQWLSDMRSDATSNIAAGLFGGIPDLSSCALPSRPKPGGTKSVPPKQDSRKKVQSGRRPRTRRR